MSERGLEKPKRNWFRLILGLLISAVAIVVVLQVANWQDLGPTLARVKWQTYAAIVVFTLIFLGLRAIAWRKLLGDVPSVWQTFFALNEGYLLNNVLPFRAGEVARAALLARQSKMSTTHVLSTIVVERAFDLVIAASLFLVTLGMVVQLDWARTVSTILLGVVLAGLVVLFIMARNAESIRTKIEKISENKPFLKQNVMPHLLGLLEGFKSLTRPSQLIFGFLFILLSWVSAVTLYTIVLRAFVPGAPLLWGVFVDSFLALGIAIPSAPAALGTFEAAIVGALSLLGIDQTTGLAYAILMHFMQFILTGFFGLMGLLLDARSKNTDEASQTHREESLL